MTRKIEGILASRRKKFFISLGDWEPIPFGFLLDDKVNRKDVAPETQAACYSNPILCSFHVIVFTLSMYICFYVSNFILYPACMVLCMKNRIFTKLSPSSSLHILVDRLPKASRYKKATYFYTVRKKIPHNTYILKWHSRSATDLMT